jgi:hypothetical protein
MARVLCVLGLCWLGFCGCMDTEHSVLLTLSSSAVSRCVSAKALLSAVVFSATTAVRACVLSKSGASNICVARAAIDAAALQAAGRQEGVYRRVDHLMGLWQFWTYLCLWCVCAARAYYLSQTVCVVLFAQILSWAHVTAARPVCCQYCLKHSQKLPFLAA